MWNVGLEGKRLGVNWTNGLVLQETSGEEKSFGVSNIYWVFLNVQPETKGEMIYGISAYMSYTYSLKLHL